MTPTKQYELLNGLPASGPMYIPVSASGELFYSEGVAVRFYKEDGTSWVANFAPGLTELTGVVTLDNSPYPLVIANGTCYLMNPEDTKPVAVFGFDYTHHYPVSKGRHVLVNSTGLTIIEPGGSYWHTKRISWDGLKVFAIEGNIVIGEAYDPTHEEDNWTAFSYDIDARILKGGSYHEL